MAAGLAAAAAAVLGLVTGCSQDVTPPPVRNLDRPSSAAFACYGDLRINGGDPTADGDLTVSAQPIASCQAHAGGTAPPGQEDLVAPHLYGFVLQSARGTVAVVDNQAGAVIDSDPLTPGKNSIPIGTLPVGLAPDRSGCYMVSANAGSCDMTSLDVTSALDISRATSIARIPITTATGDLLRAKPSTMAGGPPDDTIGVACPETPTGPLYVAYPTCHLVAVVDAATGVVQSGIQFAEDGSATLTDGAVSCPQECGDGSITPTSAVALAGEDAAPADAGSGPDAGPPPVIDQGGPRPVVLHLGTDGRLYIGSENSPIITSVGLDDTGMPTDVSDIRLQGDVGVTAMDVSDEVIEGGSLGTFGTGGGGKFRFLYAVATDRTVRAVDLTHNRECDTEVDPRYLHDIRDVARLSCLPVGDPATPPRRPGATSPGIQLPRGAAPLDVVFSTVAPPDTVNTVSPVGMVGTFAFVSSSDGFVYVVNVDDDKYPDFENADAPLEVSMPLAIPHQLRDFTSNRDGLASSCATPTADPLQLGPRLSTQPGIGLSEDSLVQEKLDLAPTLHSVACTAGGDSPTPVNELSFGAPAPVRESVWPDLRSIRNEDWSIVWEGGLSQDSSNENIDGPPVRNGLLEPGAGGTTTLSDPTTSLCQTGVEPYDIVQVLGCDPALGDTQCGIGETCYVHPDAPTVVTRGQCLPASQIDRLSGTCRDFLVSERRYSATFTAADHLTLVPRRRVLRTSPVNGCSSDQQCQDLADLVPSLTHRNHPLEEAPAAPLPSDTYDYVCRPDPTRAPDDAGQPVSRCQMACQSPDDCEPGMACGPDGLCVEGVPPPAECVAAEQRYQLRASDAFVVIGSRTGYLHDRMRDPDDRRVRGQPRRQPAHARAHPARCPGLHRQRADRRLAQPVLDRRPAERGLRALRGRERTLRLADRHGPGSRRQGHPADEPDVHPRPGRSHHHRRQELHRRPDGHLRALLGGLPRVPAGLHRDRRVLPHVRDRTAGVVSDPGAVVTRRPGVDPRRGRRVVGHPGARVHDRADRPRQRLRRAQHPVSGPGAGRERGPAADPR